MRRFIIVCLCLIPIHTYAKEKLEPIVSGKVVSFSTLSVPDRALVRVSCEFNMHKPSDQEFYAYVTPYAETFHVMAYVNKSDLHDTHLLFEEIGSKVYMGSGYTKSITIVGVTQHNEAIIIDLSHTPSATTVSCSY